MPTRRKLDCDDSLPHKGDILFKGITRTSDGGLVDWGFRERSARFGPCGQWSNIADGYFRGANAVVDEALREGGADTLVFPAVSLYRQWLEMQLKAFLDQIHSVRSSSRGWNPTHNLSELWESLQGALAHLGSDLPAESIIETGRLVKEMHERDPESTSFRYGEDKHGKSLLRGIHSIDLRNLRIVMEKIYNFFDAL